MPEIDGKETGASVDAGVILEAASLCAALVVVQAEVGAELLRDVGGDTARRVQCMGSQVLACDVVTSLSHTWVCRLRCFLGSSVVFI